MAKLKKMLKRYIKEQILFGAKYLELVKNQFVEPTQNPAAEPATDGAQADSPTRAEKPAAEIWAISVRKKYENGEIETHIVTDIFQNDGRVLYNSTNRGEKKFVLLFQTWESAKKICDFLQIARSGENETFIATQL